MSIMKRISLAALALVAAARLCNAQTNTFPSTGYVSLGAASPGNSISFREVTTDLGTAGLTWFGPDALSYGLYKTAGSWNGPNYPRLKMNWVTGIVLNPGYDQATSYVEVNGGGLRVTDGLVGIGTTAPLSLFQVDDGCTKANIGDASGAGLNYGTSYLGFNAARSAGTWTMHSDSHSNGGGLIYSSIHGDMYFAPISSTGSATQTLSDASVRGRIALRIDSTGVTHAKKVLIEVTGWPDYVFRPTYKLKPLSEVKAYIDLNRRLPEMPSDKEMGAKGMDVTEIVKLQTRKIEELTLYLIEKDKREKAQQGEIDQLKRQLATIASKLK